MSVHAHRSIGLASIRTDGGTQPRAAINAALVREYREAMDEGATFPPLVVFHDGDTYWLADGFHRHAAHVALGRKRVEVEVHEGTQRDAILFSVGANASHGLRRTNADKRRAVERLLADEEWAARSDRWIAERCAVGDHLVADMRRPTAGSRSSASRTGKDGEARKRPAPHAAPDEEPDEPEPDEDETGEVTEEESDTLILDVIHAMTIARARWPKGVPISRFIHMLRARLDDMERNEGRRTA